MKFVVVFFFSYSGGLSGVEIVWDWMDGIYDDFECNLYNFLCG